MKTTWVFLSSIFAIALAACAKSEAESKTSTVFPFCEARQCGLMDRSGDIVVQAKYDYLQQVSVSYFAATTKEGGQIIKIDGTKVDVPPFDRVTVFSPKLFIVKTEDGAYLADHAFKRISPETDYDSIERLQEDGYAVVRKGSLGGIINAKGEIVLPVEYGYLRLVGQGKAVGQAELEPALFDLKTGEFRNGPQFSDMGDFIEDRASFRGTNNLFGYLDLKGDVVIPAQFESNVDFKNGNLIVYRDNEAFVIDKDGASLFDGKVYGSVSRHGDNLFQVTPYRVNLSGIPMGKDNLIGLADTSGTLIVDHTWPSATYPKGNIFGAYVKESKLWALFDVRGNQISEPKYENLRLLSEELAWTYEDGKDFVIDLETGEMISPRRYDRKRVDSEGYASVKVNDLYGLVGPDGREIIPPLFDSHPGDGTDFGYIVVRVGDGELYSVLKDGTPIGFSFDDVKVD